MHPFYLCVFFFFPLASIVDMSDLRFFFLWSSPFGVCTGNDVTLLVEPQELDECNNNLPEEIVVLPSAARSKASSNSSSPPPSSPSSPSSSSSPSPSSTTSSDAVSTYCGLKISKSITETQLSVNVRHISCVGFGRYAVQDGETVARPGLWSSPR